MSEGLTICRACGGTLARTALVCPHCGAPQGGAANGGGDAIPRGFGSSVSICFSKYVTFAGRAPRAEYWFFALFVVLVNIVIGIISAASHEIGSILSGLFVLAVLLPSISVSVRRLHDIDRSGWWYWIALVPVVGVILLIVWFCTRGTRGPNRYGPENGAPIP
jgi:uncharacterized membrane protein YhaH (DUF805 family)